MSLPKRTRAVKRTYSSPLREDQARSTRAAIVDAAAAELAERGYAAVSVDDIAKRAGVSRATVFNAVGGKPALLRAAFERSFARAAGGGDEPVPLVSRPRSIEVRSARSSAREYLTAYAGIATAISTGLAPIYVTMRAAAQSDPEVAELLVQTNAVRRNGCTTIVADTVARGRLRPGLATGDAEDIVYVLNDPGVFHVLAIERGWAPDRFAAWLARSLIEQLLGEIIP